MPPKNRWVCCQWARHRDGAPRRTRLLPDIALKSLGQEAAEYEIAAVRHAGGPFVTAADKTRMPMIFSDPHLRTIRSSTPTRAFFR